MSTPDTNADGGDDTPRKNAWMVSSSWEAPGSEARAQKTEVSVARRVVNDVGVVLQQILKPIDIARTGKIVWFV